MLYYCIIIYFMKKSFKFGELKNYQELLIKIIGLLLFAGIIFYAVKIITSQICDTKIII